MNKKRKLIDLVSVGPRILDVFHAMGIFEVEQLVDADPDDLYQRIIEIKKMRVDPCVHDVFRTAIEQARDPNLPREKCDWFYWSKFRKGQI